MGSIAGLFRALTTYANIYCETPKGDTINISTQNYVTNMYLCSGPPSNILRGDHHSVDSWMRKLLGIIQVVMRCREKSNCSSEHTGSQVHS